MRLYRSSAGGSKPALGEEAGNHHRRTHGQRLRPAALLDLRACGLPMRWADRTARSARSGAPACSPATSTPRAPRWCPPQWPAAAGPRSMVLRPRGHRPAYRQCMQVRQRHGHRQILAGAPTPVVEKEVQIEPLQAPRQPRQEAMHVRRVHVRQQAGGQCQRLQPGRPLDQRGDAVEDMGSKVGRRLAPRGGAPAAAVTPAETHLPTVRCCRCGAAAPQHRAAPPTEL